VKTQQFETVFFKMLDTMFTIGRQIKESGREKDFFIEFMDKMKHGFKSLVDSPMTDYTNEELQIIIDISKEVGNKFHDTNGMDDVTKPHVKRLFMPWASKSPEDTQRVIGHLYMWYFQETETRLGHFFRYIYNTIKHVEREVQDEQKRKIYINLIQAQLSNYQLAVLFYSNFSKVALDAAGKPAAKELMDKYQLFENLMPMHLLRNIHQTYYPNTQFKFRWKDTIDDLNKR
jgi:hypothetical protein